MWREWFIYHSKYSALPAADHGLRNKDYMEMVFSFPGEAWSEVPSQDPDTRYLVYRTRADIKIWMFVKEEGESNGS